MTEFSVGDRVLVPGVVAAVHSEDVCDVMPAGSGITVSYHVIDLRPDTGGRDLTAQDTETAWMEAAADDTASSCVEPIDDEVIGELAIASEYSDDPWLADRDQMQVVLDVLRERGLVVHRRAAAGPRAGDTGFRSAADSLNQSPRGSGDTAPDDGMCKHDRLADSCLDCARDDLADAVAEAARLRSDAAALRDAGDELADEAYQAAMLPTHGNDHRDSKKRLTDRADAWRSAAGSPTTDQEPGR